MRPTFIQQNKLTDSSIKYVVTNFSVPINFIYKVELYNISNFSVIRNTSTIVFKCLLYNAVKRLRFETIRLIVVICTPVNLIVLISIQWPATVWNPGIYVAGDKNTNSRETRQIMTLVMEIYRVQKYYWKHHHCRCHHYHYYHYYHHIPVL